jgi:hypothetical protein
MCSTAVMRRADAAVALDGAVPIAFRLAAIPLCSSMPAPVVHREYPAHHHPRAQRSRYQRRRVLLLPAHYDD